MENLNFHDFGKKMRSLLLLTGGLYFIVGVLGLINPVLFSIYLVFILAIFFFINGVKNLTKGIKFRKVPDFHWGVFAFMGVIEILLAISLFTTPFSSQIFIIMYAGIFMIIKGIFIMVNLLTHKKLFTNLERYGVGSGVIDLLFGILLVMLPFFSQQFLFLAVSWYILFTGVNLIITGISLNKNQVEVK